MWCILKISKLIGAFEIKGMEKKRMKYDWSELEKENMGMW